MNLSDLMGSPIGQSIVKNVAGQFGLDEKQASAAVSTAIPAILGGMSKNVQTPKGAESLNKALETKHDGSLLENLGGLLGGGNMDALMKDGGGILGHIFGNQVDNVQNELAKKAGISSDKMGSIVKMLAPIVMAYLGKEKSSKNLSAGALGGLLEGVLGSGAKKKGGGLLDVVTGFLDKDKDGSALDDVIGMFSKKK